MIWLKGDFCQTIIPAACFSPLSAIATGTADDPKGYLTLDVAQKTIAQ